MATAAATSSMKSRPSHEAPRVRAVYRWCAHYVIGNPISRRVYSTLQSPPRRMTPKFRRNSNGVRARRRVRPSDRVRVDRSTESKFPPKLYMCLSFIFPAKKPFSVLVVKSSGTATFQHPRRCLYTAGSSTQHPQFLRYRLPTV